MPEFTDQVSVYDSILTRLAGGDLAPGRKLKPEELRVDYGCSASTLREVLFRLACGGYVDFEEQRGFRVPPSSFERLLDLVRLRVLIESEAATLSIARGDMEWEARLNAAHHKLAHLEARMRRTDVLSEHVLMWTRVDLEFHETLASACGSDLMQEILHSLFYRYRQQLVGLVHDYGFREGIVEEHKAILDAALARDPARCAAAIRRHFAFIDNLQPTTAA